jgi:hypothetical protein
MYESYVDFAKQEGFVYESCVIPGNRIPDSLPEPFFKVTAAKFIAIFAAQQVSDEVELARYDILFDCTAYAELAVFQASI